MTDVREAGLSDVLVAPGAGAGAGGEVAVPRGRLPAGRPSGGGLAALPGLRTVSRMRWRPLLWAMLYLSPTLLAGGYFGLVASGRYVSHAVFIVRTASKPAGDTGFGALLRMAGLGRAEDDTYSVKNFIESRDAVRQLQGKLPLAEMYGRAGIDPLSRYPNLIYDATNEDLYRYYLRMVSAAYNTATGVTDLSVQAFRPDDALAISSSLLQLAEDLVNQLNSRIRADALSSAETELKRQEDRLTEAQVAVTAFQNRETMIDPISNSVIVSEIVGKLQNDLAQNQARIADMVAGSPNNPSLPALKRQADVTRGEIEREQARVTSAKEGLADKLGQYQRLVLDREFATKALTLATTSLDSARSDARRKQLYLQRVVEPELTDKATLPLRTWTTFSVFLVNIFVLFIGWMLKSGVKEHISSTR